LPGLARRRRLSRSSSPVESTARMILQFAPTMDHGRARFLYRNFHDGLVPGIHGPAREIA
jgi:hypothetical protein